MLIMTNGDNTITNQSPSEISRIQDHRWPSSLYRDPVQFWSLVILSTAVYGIVPLGETGRAINLSLFDFIVVLLFAIALRDRAVRLDRFVGLATLGAVALILIHSAIFLLSEESIELAGLARETMKSAAYFVEVLLLSMLVKAGGSRLPNFRVLGLLFALLTFQALALHFRELYAPGSWFLPRNQHLATLSGIVVLAAVIYAVGNMPRRYLISGLVTLISVAFILLNKTYLSVAVAILALLPYLKSTNRGQPDARIVSFLAFVLFVVFAMLFGSGDALRDIPLLDRLDTIFESLGFRFQLWGVAGNAAVGSFPIGIGLGQFASYLTAEPTLDSQALRFVHNTPLALVVEMGLAGIIVGGLVVALIVRATRGLPITVSIAIWVYLGLPMLLHDALGLRMAVLVLATGLAGALRWDRRR
jgi:hypothetical protein